MTAMFQGQNPYLIALSVMIAIIGGYTGFGLAARVRGTGAVSRRLFLAGAAFFFAVSIWTMHFIGMLAATIPAGAVYLVLPTILSFLICALVMGVSLFFVSVGEPSELRVGASALLLGIGIVSMHYVGVHGLAGDFRLRHDHAVVALAALIAVAAAYGGLRVFLAPQEGKRLALSAMAFGVAVSGMHYTAMFGMRFDPAPAATPAVGDLGPVASPQVLALIVSLLCFLIAAGFLLLLVPEPLARAMGPSTVGPPDTGGSTSDLNPHVEPTEIAAGPPAPQPSAVTALGQPSTPIAKRVPVAAAEGTQFVDVSQIRSVRADAHYTLVHDGSRERMSPWSISEAETHLDRDVFLRVHRSHIVSISHVTLIRKEGDGAVVELDGAPPYFVPVSRPKIAELRARLGLLRRSPATPHSDK